MIKGYRVNKLRHLDLKYRFEFIIWNLPLTRFYRFHLILLVFELFFSPCSQEVENLRKQAEIIPQLMAECETITAKLQVYLPDPFGRDLQQK